MVKNNGPLQTIPQALTFDDVLLTPAYSEVLPSETNISTDLGPRVQLQSPLLSAAMDTVTEHRMAIAMSLLGGLGVLHKNMPPAEQAEEVRRVKSFRKVSFELGKTGSSKDENSMAVDGHGRLLVGAAVGVSELDLKERLPALVDSDVDLIVVDTAHGHSKRVLLGVSEIKKRYGDRLTVVAGNIATGDAARALADAGADVVKVGIGPGSICTTRIVAGIGIPQLTAIFNVASALHETSIKIIADGGVKYSGDIVKALAAGAHAVMIGSLLASSEESPGELLQIEGKVFKRYRGMGSLGAMRKGSKDRYFQGHLLDHKLVAEGIEGRVPHKGTVADIFDQLLGGLRAGMGYIGAQNILEMHAKAAFVQITPAGLRESHVHDVTMTDASFNYHPLKT